MRWPALRFEVFFERHLCRKAAEQLGREKDLMIAAIAANTNMDNPKNQEIREKRVNGIYDSYKRGVELLYSRSTGQSQGPQADAFEDDALFRKARNMREEISRPVHENEGLGARLLGEPS